MAFAQYPEPKNSGLIEAICSGSLSKSKIAYPEPKNSGLIEARESLDFADRSQDHIRSLKTPASLKLGFTIHAGGADLISGA